MNAVVVQPEVQLTAGETEAASLLQIIADAAANPNVNIDKMERLMEMRKQVMARAAEVSYHAAMTRAQRAMPSLKKDKFNDQTKSWYSSLASVVASAVPIYTQEGFSVSFGTEQSPLEGHIRVVADVMHDNGHMKRYYYDNPIDLTGIAGKVNKTQTHGRSSGVAYGRRYLLNLIFNLNACDDDNDGNGVGTATITEEQEATLRDMIESSGANAAQFLKYLKVDSLSDLPAVAYEDAMKALRQKMKTKQGTEQ